MVDHQRIVIAEIVGIVLLLLALAGIQIRKQWQKRRRYSHRERARLISEAIETSKNLRVVYWSRTEKKMIRCVFTPHTLESVFVEGYDHTNTRARRLKTTRIKELEIVDESQPGKVPAPDPARWTVRVLMVVLALGIVALFGWLVLHEAQ